MCAKCRARRATLYDLPEGFICLTCALGVYDETQTRDVRRLIRAAVTGEINIEKRQRAIAKRKRWAKKK